MHVGTKELKNRLSHYLELVREGEAIQVTARGKVVAELRAVLAGQSDDETCIEALERAGLATRGTERAREVKPIATRAVGGSTMLVSSIVVEDRE